MRLGEQLIPELDREMARTRRVLESLSAEHLSWQPHESLHTIGWNANHLVDILGWTQAILQRDEYDMAPLSGPKDEPSAHTDPALILTDFDRNLQIAREAISAASDATMAELWSLKAGGQTLFTIPKGECLRTWVFNHTVHHRAILSVYLRMLGVELTPVYDG